MRVVRSVCVAALMLAFAAQCSFAQSNGSSDPSQTPQNPNQPPPSPLQDQPTGIAAEQKAQQEQQMGLRGVYDMGGWHINPSFRFELERQGHRPDLTQVIPIDRLDYDSNRLGTAMLLVEPPNTSSWNWRSAIRRRRFTDRRDIAVPHTARRSPTSSATTRTS